MSNRYTVVGQPIAHSKSPTIHCMFGEQTGRNIIYTRTESTPSNFAQTLDEWQQAGGKGCNVTLPFKEIAVKLCDQLDQSANDAQAVNTIHFQDGKRYGYNTDGSGLLRDLSNNQNFTVTNKRILLIGAGGAARGALGPLIAQAPHSITIANRTVDKAKALAAAFPHMLCGVMAVGYQDIGNEDRFDLVINATSLSLQKTLPPLPTYLFAPGALSYDMMYGIDDTIFMDWSRQHRATQVCDGLGMLIEQAADAFAIWEGVRPDTKTVYTYIRSELK
ncbi:MAG: shikimate dehydrogenase [Granulosicoccaceae bacterium]